jgi:hypothetical protein
MNATQIQSTVTPISEAVAHGWRGAHRIESLVENLWSDITGEPGAGRDGGAVGPSMGIASDADRLSYRLHELAEALERIRSRVTANNVASLNQMAGMAQAGRG